MKNLFFIPLLFSFLNGVAQQTIDGDSWKAVQAKGEGTLSVVYYECPRLIEKIDGEMKGVCVDIMNDFVAFVKTKYNKKVNVNYMAKEVEFGQFLKRVKTSNNILGVSNTTISTERKAEMKFSPYYLKTPLIVLTNSTVTDYKTLSDLVKSGLSAQVERETAYATFIEKLKSKENSSFNIQYQPTTKAVLDQLLTSNKYFSVIDFTEYLGEVKVQKSIKRQPINLGYADQLGFVMSKKSDWDILFNEFLTDNYRESATYKQSIMTNLGGNFMAMVK